MADHTDIEWTEATWNPITGCSVASPGCSHCYAMSLAGTRLQHHPSRIGLTREVNGNFAWTGEVRFNEQWLTQPLRWRRARHIFVVAHGDLFHERVPDEWIDRVFAVMAMAPQHTFQVLTKRAARMRQWFDLNDDGDDRLVRVAQAAGQLMEDGDTALDVTMRGPWPLPNVWLGVSCERQIEADVRVPDLLATPAAVRWVSAEPLLGPIDFTNIKCPYEDCADRHVYCRVDGTFDGLDSPFGSWRHINWIVVGGESGQRARPMHPDWARSIRDQCAAAGVPYFFKQWGAWSPYALIPGSNLGDLVRAGLVRITHPTGQSDFEVFSETGRNTIRGSVYMQRVGKNAAGRLLDGRNWDEMPRSYRDLEKCK